MKIERIHTHQDPRFSQVCLDQHGCFLADSIPFEVEILFGKNAVIRGDASELYPAVIREFRKYAPHVTRFFDDLGHVVTEFPDPCLLKVPLNGIQPSQFCVDEEKSQAIQRFINTPEDVVIPLACCNGQYIAMDGHTRLYLAAAKGWAHVYGIEQPAEAWLCKIVEEVQARGVHAPNDLALLSHTDYEEQWLSFCRRFFAESDKH